MSYSRPMVMVFQEYASTSGTTASAQLPTCIVGPCYHIIDATADETLASAGMYTSGGLTDAFFPNNTAGALIEADSVKIRLKNAYITIAADVAVTAQDANSVTIGTENFPAAAVGDYVYLDSDTEQVYRITSLDSTTGKILMNRSVPTGTTKFTVRRLIAEIILEHDSSYLTVDAPAEKFSLSGVKYTTGGKDYPVFSASVFVGYKSLRKDLSTVTTVQSADEIVGKLGKIVPENPLAFGVSICLANTTTSVMCIGVDSDDLAGYTAAKDKLETMDPVYSIVPLTYDAGILSMFKMHAEEMSTAAKGHWRLALGCSKLQTLSTPAAGKGKVSQDGNKAWIVFTATKGTVSTADGSVTPVAFLSDGVDAGDALIITDGAGQEHTYTVAYVLAEDILTITPSSPFDTLLQTGEFDFKITHNLDKTEQAKAVAAVSKSYGSKRFVHVWPDICVVDNTEVPGYYLACAVAGGIAGLPSQYGFTRLSMAGISGLKHSNDYFSQDQLDTIAGGGTFIFMQEAEGAAPYVRHQLTTDLSTTEFQELSFVKNFDYVSYICRDNMDQFIGKWNVTPATMKAIQTSLTATFETLKLANEPKIGAPILAYTITSVKQLESDRTRVEAYANVTFPYPLNTIGLHLISQ